jgi:hypothetical protein
VDDDQASREWARVRGRGFLPVLWGFGYPLSGRGWRPLRRAAIVLWGWLARADLAVWLAGLHPARPKT